VYHDLYVNFFAIGTAHGAIFLASSSVSKNEVEWSKKQTETGKEADGVSLILD
jgi:hypothetical protein